MVCERCGYEYCECHDHEEQYGDEYGFENIPDDAWDDYDSEYPDNCGLEL